MRCNSGFFLSLYPIRISVAPPIFRCCLSTSTAGLGPEASLAPTSTSENSQPSFPDKKWSLLHATLSSASLAVLSPPPLLAHLSSSSSSLSFLLMLTCTHHSVSSSVSSSTEALHMLSPSSAYTCCTSKKLCFCNCNIFKHSVLLQSNPCLLGFDWVRFLQVVAFFTRIFWEPLLPGSASMAVSHSSSPGTATAVRPL